MLKHHISRKWVEKINEVRDIYIAYFRKKDKVIWYSNHILLRPANSIQYEHDSNHQYITSSRKSMRSKGSIQICYTPTEIVIYQHK